MPEEMTELDGEAASALAPLVGIGCQSGDTVMGLSAVRRARRLAFVFADSALAEGTLGELGRLRASGTRVYRVTPLRLMTAVAGREDVLVLGITPGSLADGIASKV